MRGVGIIMILCASFSFGVTRMRDRKRRLHALRDLCAALEILTAELRARAEALPALCAFLSERAEGAAELFFTLITENMETLGERSFYEIWADAGEKAFPFLRAAEREELCRLGKALGRYDLEQQLAWVESCHTVLSDSLQRAEKAYPEERKLELGVPMAVGILLAIVLA